MNPRKITYMMATIAVAMLGLTAVSSPAQAADAVHYTYAASTGGTFVKIANGNIQSDLTAQSSVTGGPKSSSNKNSTAATSIKGIAEVGAIESSTDAKVSSGLLGDTTTLTSWSRLAHVSLLGGLISADAIETKASTTGRQNGTAVHNETHKLADLNILGIKVPARIPKNWSVTIPGVANVTANYVVHGQKDGLTVTMTWALSVTLLQARAGMEPGVTILVAPAYHSLYETDPDLVPSVGGTAYGTRVEAHAAGDTVSVTSDPTARVGTPVGSSYGKTITNATLGVRVPGILKTGVIVSKTTSDKDDFGNAEVTNSNQIANVNLLGGLITAKAIKVTATSKLQDGKWTHSEGLDLVNLVVAGQKIPINIGPNTEIDIAGLGKITINEQQSSDAGYYQTLAYGVRITLDTAKAGLPVGAVIELGTAYTQIMPTT
ncbi:MAG: hypothetical protein L0H31_04770 [Nocardioidaceae bacterium]|nr:hypothetical protein [Nocardioidaceae bacterium]